MKLFVVFVSILFVASEATSTNSDFIEDGVRRSAVCLIERVAVFNNVTAVFELTNKTKIDGMDHFIYKLTVGTELYNASATSAKKTKEKCAREAYALTKYKKPPLKERTCVIGTIQVKSNLSILFEYATYLNQTLQIDEKHINQSPNMYEITISLNGKQASATGHSKKRTKQEAAQRVLDLFGKSNVIHALVWKFNETRYHGADPTERLAKIVKAWGLNEEVKYTVNEADRVDSNGNRIHEFTVEAEARDDIASESGITPGEAKNNAAKQILKNMGFTVTFSHNSNKKN